jgi:hypothetical protein
LHQVEILPYTLSHVASMPVGGAYGDDYVGQTGADERGSPAVQPR